MSLRAELQKEYRSLEDAYHGTIALNIIYANALKQIINTGEAEAVNIAKETLAKVALGRNKVAKKNRQD